MLRLLCLRSWFCNRQIYNYLEYSMPIPIYLSYVDYEVSILQ